MVPDLHIVCADRGRERRTGHVRLVHSSEREGRGGEWGRRHVRLMQLRERERERETDKQRGGESVCVRACSVLGIAGRIAA